MARRTAVLVLAAVGLLGTAGRGPSGEPQQPDLKPLLAEVQALVQKHYPKADVALADGTISFAFNTRKYMIHEPLLTGEWQDAFEEVGPQRGGLCGAIELRDGRYGGQAALPQAFDKRYFTTLRLAPYSKKLDRHLDATLKCPADMPREFREQFVRLMDDFDKYVTASGK